MTKSSDAPPRVLYWILAAAFLLRVAAVFLAHIEGYISDEREYIFLANQLNAGHGFVDSNGAFSVKAPVFPMLLALCFRIWPSSHFLPFLLIVLMATLSTYAVYALAFRVWQDRKAALYAAGAMAFFPSVVLYGGLLMTETLFIFLLLLTLLLSERLRRENGYLLHLLFGLIAGAAVLTRAAGFGLIPVLLLVIAVLRRQTGIPPHRLLVAFSVWILVLTPWTVRNVEVHGTLIPISTFGGRAFLTGSNPFAHGTAKLDPGYYTWRDKQLIARGFAREDGQSEAREMAAERAIGVDYAIAHPWRYLTLALQKAYILWVYPVTYGQDSRSFQASFMMFDILLWLSAAGGIAVGMMRRISVAVIVAPIVFFTAMNMLLYAEARFRLPAIPLVCILAGGAAHLFNADERRLVLQRAGTRRLLIDGSLLVVIAYGLAAALFLGGLIS